MMNYMDELERVLKIPCSPTTSGKEFIKVVCGVDFEPHGRASETWEIVWKLTLPQIPLHWKSTTGWRPGTADKSMFFSGRTFNDVVQQAISFLKER